MKSACKLTDHSIDSIMAERNITKNKTSQIIDDVTALRLHYSLNAYGRCPDAIQIESLSFKLNVSPSAIKAWFRSQRQLAHKKKSAFSQVPGLKKNVAAQQPSSLTESGHPYFQTITHKLHIEAALPRGIFPVDQQQPSPLSSSLPAHKKKSACSQVTELKQNAVPQQPPSLTEACHPYFQTITHKLHTETSPLPSINEKRAEQRPSPPVSTLSDVDNAYLRSLSKRYNRTSPINNTAIPGLMVKLEQSSTPGPSSSDTVIYPSFQSIAHKHQLKMTTPNTQGPSSIHIPSDHLISRDGEDKENIVVKISGRDEILTSQQMVQYMKQIYSKTNLTTNSHIQKRSQRGDGLRRLVLDSNY